MEVKISKNPQTIVIYRINSKDLDKQDDADLFTPPHGKTLVGNLFLYHNALIVKDIDGVVLGVFSLDTYYFIKPTLP